MLAREQALTAGRFLHPLTPPRLLHLELYEGATRDFLHLTTASTPPCTPTTTSLCTSTPRRRPLTSQAPSAACLRCMICIPCSLIQLLVRNLMIRRYTPIASECRLLTTMLSTAPPPKPHHLRILYHESFAQWRKGCSIPMEVPVVVKLIRVQGLVSIVMTLNSVPTGYSHRPIERACAWG
jgi:hypothetical protein